MFNAAKTIPPSNGSSRVSKGEGLASSVIGNGIDSRKSQQIALATLIAAGFLLGLSTNLAKHAHTMMLAPLSYLAWSLAGATLLLLAYARKSLGSAPCNWRTAEYFLVSGLLSTGGSNLIFYYAIPQLGAAFVSLMLSLPPMLTYLAALALRMETFRPVRLVGVAAAMAGASWLAVMKLETADASLFWLCLTATAPIMLAAGNIYRTTRWPTGMRAEVLAPGMAGASTGMLVAVSLWVGAPLNILAFEADQVLLIAVQSLVFATQFLLLFVLQKSGGPVFLSLLGGVGAVFGVPIAVGLLGEDLPPGLFTGSALIALGIVLLAFVTDTNAGVKKV